MFTSNLSAREFVLAEQEKAIPIRQVMGNSVYQIGNQISGIRLATGDRLLAPVGGLKLKLKQQADRYDWGMLCYGWKNEW